MWMKCCLPSSRKDLFSLSLFRKVVISGKYRVVEKFYDQFVNISEKLLVLIKDRN